jgi:catechol 2,3-dioxygenase-like lactoylglutathione lyase family enzyme
VSYRLTAIDHVQLAMPPGPDAERAAEEFYGGLLGLERLEKPEPLAARGGCWFSNGVVVLHLGVEADFRAARKAHPALVVDDLDALAGALEAAQREVRPDHELPGVRRCYVDDPFGNRIELIDGR